MSTTAGLSREKLEGEERERRLREEVPFWQQVSCRDAIQRTFNFKDFKEAWRFMNLTAEKAEEMDHHPEWFNVYNRVEVTLATHTCKGVSEYDVVLAKAMDQFALQAAEETLAAEEQKNKQ